MIKFKHGNPLYEDFVNPSDTDVIPAGTVINVGGMARVAHVDIPPRRHADDLCTIASSGGVYEGIAGNPYLPGEAVDYDEASNKFVPSIGAGLVFGHVEANSSSAADGDTIRVVHKPK